MIENKSIISRIRVIITYIVVVGLALLCIFPLWNVICISFSSSSAVAKNAVSLVPVDFTLVAYEKILADSQFFRSFGISTFRTVVSLCLNLVLIVLMAYPLSKTKYEFKARNIYMFLTLIAMLFNGGLIPTYIVVKELGLLNSVFALILPGAVPVFSVILVMNFFIGIPKSLEEAAFIDGASSWRVLFNVYIPCSKPVIATVSLYSIVNSWNEFFSGLVYMTKIKNYPLMSYIQSLNIKPEELADIVSSGGSLDLMELSNRNLNAAKVVVAVIPLLIIYPLLQKYLISGMVVGAVKE